MFNFVPHQNLPMALIEEYEKTGNWLFRYRSFMPVLMFMFFILFMIADPYEMVDFNTLWWMGVCFLISLAGLIIRAIVIGHVPKGTSGKNREIQVAEKLNTSGIYSVVRHPLYLGNFLIWLGPVMYTGNPWLVVLISLFFWIYYERIMFAEEMFLRNKYGSIYLEWAATTPAFIPSFKHFRKPELPFSFRNVLKRESHALVNAVLTFAFINASKYLIYRGELNLDLPWIILSLFSLLLFLVLRIIIKKTSLLNVQGR
jgi:protein-S-isoprenylcysteine O-methyltransferase Ste14